MTNIFQDDEKVSTKTRLVNIAIAALQNEGWSVDRIPRSGKSSVRRITRGKEQKTVSIRTTQDTWIAFPRNAEDNGWITLSDVDCVVAASVDDRRNPRYAQIHMLPAAEVLKRFERAYAARRKADHVIPEGRGVWLSLYEQDSALPVSLVGAGLGLDYPAFAKTPLAHDEVVAGSQFVDRSIVQEEDAPLTIAEAKRRLALTLGVAESDIKITING